MTEKTYQTEKQRIVERAKIRMDWGFEIDYLKKYSGLELNKEEISDLVETVRATFIEMGAPKRLSETIEIAKMSGVEYPHFQEDAVPCAEGMLNDWGWIGAFALGTNNMVQNITRHIDEAIGYLKEAGTPVEKIRQLARNAIKTYQTVRDRLFNEEKPGYELLDRAIPIAKNALREYLK